MKNTKQNGAVAMPRKHSESQLLIEKQRRLNDFDKRLNELQVKKLELKEFSEINEKLNRVCPRRGLPAKPGCEWGTACKDGFKIEDDAMMPSIVPGDWFQAECRH